MKTVLERNLSFIGYPNYSVDTEGNVWSHKYGKVRKLKGNNNGDGYYQVDLRQDGVRKTLKVHKLIALAFIPNPDNKPCIDHINTIRTDNRVSNLRWCTHKENCNNPISIKHYSISRKGEKHPLARAVLQYTIDGEFVAEYPTLSEAAKKTNSNENKICMVCKGKRNIAGGFVWKYKKEND